MGFLTMGPPANMPNMFEIPNFDHILELWHYSDQAMEVSAFFQQLFSRLPPYFLAFFALCFVFIVVPLVVSMIEKIL